MLAHTSLPSELPPLTFQVEAEQAALHQMAASQRSTRFLWSGLGFAVLMLIGFPAYAPLPIASHASAKSARLPPELAFIPSVPALGYGALHSAKQAGSLLSAVVKQRHQIPSTHMSEAVGPSKAPNGGSDDDHFQFALSRLAPTEELPDLYRKMRVLDIIIDDAIHEEDYKQAEQFRTNKLVLTSQDPVHLFHSLRSSMWAAAKDGRFGEANKIEAQMHSVRKLLPQYQLGGRWMGTHPDQSDGTYRFAVQIEYDGDTLIASHLHGEVVFKADIKESKSKGCRSMINGQSYMKCFQGVGRVDEGQGIVPGVNIPGSVPGMLYGMLYLLDDGGIAFKWSGGGDTGALEPAGGLPELVLSGQDQTGKGAGGSSSHGDGGGGEGGGVFTVFFECKEKYDVAARRREYQQSLLLKKRYEEGRINKA